MTDKGGVLSLASSLPMVLQNIILDLYHKLYNEYGPQGWWPVTDTDSYTIENNRTENPYHPGVYNFPQNDTQRFEICVGAVLTQNTNWKNVQKALKVLYKSGLFSLEKILTTKNDQIALAIKSAGYYNQKAQYLKNLALFLEEYSFSKLESLSCDSVRKKLLKIKGIGPETADCILLYALNKCSFVVDAYTKRILTALEIISHDSSYESMKKLFESSLDSDLILFQEYHALLVLHGKKNYSKKPYGKEDTILFD